MKAICFHSHKFILVMEASVPRSVSLPGHVSSNLCRPPLICLWTHDLHKQLFTGLPLRHFACSVASMNFELSPVVANLVVRCFPEKPFLSTRPMVNNVNKDSRNWWRKYKYCSVAGIWWMQRDCWKVPCLERAPIPNLLQPILNYSWHHNRQYRTINYAWLDLFEARVWGIFKISPFLMHE